MKENSLNAVVDCGDDTYMLLACFATALLHY